MIVCSFFYAKNLKNLENNHKKFSDLNNFLHKKYYIEEDNLQKYSIVLKELQENPNETFIFIDSYTYFNRFKFDFIVSPDIMVQKDDNRYYESLFIVKSTDLTIKIFKTLYKDYSYHYSKNNKKHFKFNITEDSFLKYPYAQNNLYLSVNLDGTNIFDKPELALTTFCNFNSFYSIAEALCNYKKNKFEHSKEPFETINANQENAIVMLYTDEVRDYSIISEKNYKDYCLKNNLTLYVYRKQIDQLKNTTGNWAKPYVLLNHINNHKNIVWADSDTLISMDYKIDFSNDITVYDDVSNWFFNSGFMIFKNTETNKKLLESIVSKINSMLPINGIYVNGGDQKLFIDEVLKFYPSIEPVSNLLGNTHPFTPFPIDKFENKLYHFMGLGSAKVRAAIMQYYYKKIKD